MSIRRWLIRLLGGKPQPPLLNRQQGEIWLRERMQRLSRSDLEDIIIQSQEGGKKNWFVHYMAADRENRRIKELLQSDYHTEKDLNRALHMSDLERKNRRLKREVREMQLKAEEFNTRLYATGLIVNCTGCDPGKPFDGENLTDERVVEVEYIAKRLRAWWENHKHRRERSSV